MIYEPTSQRSVPPLWNISKWFSEMRTMHRKPSLSRFRSFTLALCNFSKQHFRHFSHSMKNDELRNPFYLSLSKLSYLLFIGIISDGIWTMKHLQVANATQYAYKSSNWDLWWECLYESMALAICNSKCVLWQKTEQEGGLESVKHHHVLKDITDSGLFEWSILILNHHLITLSINNLVSATLPYLNIENMEFRSQIAGCIHSFQFQFVPIDIDHN